MLLGLDKKGNRDNSEIIFLIYYHLSSAIRQSFSLPKMTTSN